MGGDFNFFEKSFEEMTRFEYVTWGVLGALEAWLSDRGGNAHKLFSLFDVDQDGSVSHEEFFLGLLQTRLDPIPTSDEIRWMFKLIDENDDGSLSLSEMHKVMLRFKKEREKKKN